MNGEVELQTKDTVKISIDEKNINNVTYVFKNKDGVKVGEYRNTSPATLSLQSNIGKQFKDIIDPKQEYKPAIVNKKFLEFKELLQLTYELSLQQREQEQVNMVIKAEQDANKKKSEAERILKDVQHIYSWIGSRVDWLTAGERRNILYAFTVYASQIILKNPISLVALGDSSSGKTHIQNIAISLLPREYVVDEKKITESAFFLRAQQDKYFYDGKIVNYGDMGGDNDQDFVYEAKNLMKELQSEGHLKKPKSVPDGSNGWEVQDLELIGRPCLTYTTVPNYQFDDQELSRSIIITPRTDNKREYQTMQRVLEFKGGIADKYQRKFKKELEIVPYIILHLREALEDVEIVNPYIKVIESLLDSSNFYKRDYDKYNGLLKTITALNYYNHEIIHRNGRDILFVSISDVELYMSLIQPYINSISSNLPPKAVEILNDYLNHKDKWIDETGRLMGISINEYFELQTLNLARRSVANYFGTLRSNGYMKIVDKEGRLNIYDVTEHVLSSDKFDLKNIDETMFEDVYNQYENDEEVLNMIKNDKYVDNLSVMNNDVEVPLPDWIKGEI